MCVTYMFLDIWEKQIKITVLYPPGGYTTAYPPEGVLSFNIKYLKQPKFSPLEESCWTMTYLV